MGYFNGVIDRSTISEFRKLGCNSRLGLEVDDPSVPYPDDFTGQAHRNFSIDIINVGERAHNTPPEHNMVRMVKGFILLYD